ncbi:hypothetical protein EV421DRAFT_1741807 [Armillaria borealis]|uniref:Uncharacterized protein n=1 Tax=Armillaria borealis TaxID=47425 RepID=A0AA39J1G8_9AGAR|nr:hypothetical protein EV421DRAFT_1741807 [Armillaria borealis]
MLIFLKCELMQSIWRLLLDEEFMNAYWNGIIIRLFTYSADYPEKILLASIKHLGNCLCPHCLIVKDNVFPKNAFSEVLLAEGVNFYELFVPDQMHEVEICGWKLYFNHLIRICHSCGSDISCPPNIWLVDNLKKKFAARDYEDTIQCAFPCFEGLLPEHSNAVILDNLFDFATWHGFTKLRMHMESMLQVYEALMTSLGKQLRIFEMKICLQFQTKETPSKAGAWLRRQTQ